MPVGAPRDLHVRITTPTSAHATWTGVPNTRESIRGKLLGYKVLAQLCGNCRSTCPLAMGLKVENLGRVAQRSVRIAITRSIVLSPHARIQTTADGSQYNYSAADSNTSVTSVNMAMVFLLPFSNSFAIFCLYC